MSLLFEVELLDWEEPGGSNGYASLLVIVIAIFLFAFAAYRFHMKKTGAEQNLQVSPAYY